MEVSGGAEDRRRQPAAQIAFDHVGDHFRVIPAVLQPAKAWEDEGDRVSMTDVADDSTHDPRAPMRPLTWCNPSGRPHCAAGGRRTPRGDLSSDSLGRESPPRRRVA